MDRAIPTIFSDRVFRYIAIIVLFVALLNRVDGLAILAASLLAFVYGARIWSKASKHNIVLYFDAADKRLFPGESVPLSLAVENQKILPVWLQINFPASVSQFLNTDLVKESSLLWYQKVEWELQLKATRRGCYLVKPPFLSIGDPFGLFREQKEPTSVEPVELIVYPEIFNLNLPYLPRKVYLGNISDRAGLVKDPVFLAGTREYQNNGPARYINWKASARYQTLQEKIFESSTELKVLFLIDVSNFKDEDEIYFEKMLETAASMAVALDHDGIAFGLISNGCLAGKVEKKAGLLPVRRNGEQLTDLLELLARMQQKSIYSLEELLEREEIAGGTTVINFNLTLPGVSKAREILREKRLAAMNIICRPVEGKPGSDNLYHLEDFLPERDDIKRDTMKTQENGEGDKE